jgi:hypothetical protein
MTEQQSRPKATERKRGIGFPQMTLQDAVDAIVVAGQNGASHSVDAFAAYLGHQTTNSGAFKGKLAALRDYGLILRGDKERVTLSERAQDLVMLAPDHYQAKHLLLPAFENCRAFGTVHADSAKNTPLEIPRIRTTVVMRHGVASDQADKFVDVFIKSAVFAGIADSDGAKVRLYPRDVVFRGTDATSAGDSTYEDVDTSMSAVSGTGSVGQYFTPSMVVNTMTSVPTALRQAWDIDGGEIEFVIRTRKPLPPEIYALVADMALVAKKMAGLLQPEPDPVRAELPKQKVGLVVGDSVDDQ